MTTIYGNWQSVGDFIVHVFNITETYLSKDWYYVEEQTKDMTIYHIFDSSEDTLVYWIEVHTYEEIGDVHEVDLRFCYIEDGKEFEVLLPKSRGKNLTTDS